MKSRNPGYRPGDHWLIDERTGFAIRKSQARQEWTGTVTHKRSWESRQPQDFVRSRQDNQAPQGFNRSEPQDFFVSVDFSKSFTAVESGDVSYEDAVYANTLNRIGSFSTEEDGNLITVGQDLNVEFKVNQGFLRFDLSTFTGEVSSITSVTLQLGIILDESVTDFNLEVLGYLWNNKATPEDFRTQTELGSLVIPATLATSVITGNGTIAQLTTNSILDFANILNLDPNLDSGTTADFVLFSDNNRNGVAPSGLERVIFAGPNNPTENLRPVLTINTSPKRITPVPSSSFNQSTL